MILYEPHCYKWRRLGCCSYSRSRRDATRPSTSDSIAPKAVGDAPTIHGIGSVRSESVKEIVVDGATQAEPTNEQNQPRRRG